MMLRAVLVDDEPPARRKLRHLLAGETDICIAGEAGSGGAAVELLNRLQPDIAFLDIQLPDCSGFDVVDALASRNSTHIVFVTAHDDFALKAFDANAADYLLKPVEPSRFAESLNRIRRLRETPQVNQLASRLDELMAALRVEPAFARRLLVQENDRSVFVEVARIDFLEAAGNYVCLYCGEKTFILRASLESIAAKLDPALFRRLNRAQIVNLDRVAEVRPWFHGDQRLLLKTGKELKWSRRYRGGPLEDLEHA
jgi:two-component system LytT family response regulator